MTMHSIFITCGVILLAWLIISQMIAAFLIDPRSDDDQKMTIAAGIFMAPALLAMIGLAFAHQRLLQLANKYGLPVNVSDNPMDYLL